MKNDISFNEMAMEEDYVEYRIYHGQITNTSNSNYLDRLNEYKIQYLKFLEAYLKDYIWQRDEFELNVWDPNKQPKHSKGNHFVQVNKKF